MGIFKSGILDFVQESLIVFDLGGRILSWNKASERIYRRSCEDAEGRHFDEMLGGRSWPSAEQMTCESSPIELHRKTACGQDIIVSTQLSLRYSPLGDPLDFVETGVDVTSQKRAEAAAEAGRRHYRNVFQAIPASVWDIDFSRARIIAKNWLESVTIDPREWFATRPDQVRALMRATFVRDVNDRAVELFGPCVREDLLISVERFWPSGSTSAFADWVASALAQEPYFACETRQCRFNGEEFDALFTASFAAGMADEGKVVVTIVDYSAIKEGQAAVRKSEAFYGDMFHGSAFSAWHLDASETQGIYKDLRRRGVTDLRAHSARHPELILEIMETIKVVDLNATSLGMFQVRDRSEVIGRSITPFWFPTHLETLIGSLSASFNSEPNYRGLTRMRTLTGNAIDVLYTKSASSTLRSAGQLLLAIVDMSDKVKAQSAMAEMQATFSHAARVSSLGELTASIAHEVNQPLAAISVNGEAALRWLDRVPPNVNKIVEITREMIADARRATNVVAHIRSMSAPQIGLQKRLSLGALVDDALTLMGSPLMNEGVVVVRHLHSALPEILGDAIQLQQVIVNLIINSLQAMSGIRNSRLIVRTETAGRSVLLRVEDNGPGITNENIQKLFGSFFTTKSDGMGMGLAICRTIVEAHGGTILAANMESGGACFTVSLPLARDKDR